MSRFFDMSRLGIVFLGFLIPFFLSGPNPVLARNTPDLTVALNTLAFSIDSPAYLSITVTGASSADIDLPEVENLIFQRREQRSSTQVINSSITSSITYIYVIQALRTGTFTIPSFKVKTGNEILLSEPLTFEVKSGSSLNEPNPVSTEKENDSSKNVFVIVEGLPEKAYVGEILPVQIKAYFRQGIRAEIQRIPEINGEGFMLNPSSGEAEQKVEAHNGRTYSVITWRSSLSPIKEGQYDFQVNLDSTLLVPQKNSRSPFFGNDPLADDFFGDLFGSIKREEVHLLSPKHPMVILPLPQQGRPESFSGAVGRFEFDLKAAPDTIGIGDPVTLTMTISGKGNFDRVSAPQFPAGSEWKTYSPTVRFENDGSSYQGKKIFEQAIVAERAEIKAIPALSFSFFDPEKQTYVTKTTAALPLTIKVDPAHASAPAVSPAELATSPPQQSESPPAVQLRLETGTFVTEIIPVYQRSWFIAILILCTLLLLSILTVTLLRNHRAGNSELLLQKRQRKHLSAELQALMQDIEAGDEAAFVLRCRRIIQAQLALPWKMAPAAITLHDLQSRLPADSPLILLFAATEEHAYGGLHLSTEEMKKYFTVVEKELGEVIS